ncbi:MAG: LPP20 family lipoprotein [Nitrospira sp.]|nr:LPP20 family lipoprotein [Nitrospira sp.]
MRNNAELFAVMVGLWLGGVVLLTAAQAAEVGQGSYASDQYWIGRGQGDLAKGKVVCRRVSELSARTDLAKQIRVLVKEHMTDRVRERSGRESEQDIELTREEIVQEYLQDVKIIDHRIDEENKICTATAVMPKSRIEPRPSDISDPIRPSPANQ